MKSESNSLPGSVIYLSHGGGPLPLLGDKGHQNMIHIIKEVTPTLIKPSAILVISCQVSLGCCDQSMNRLELIG